MKRKSSKPKSSRLTELSESSKFSMLTTPETPSARPGGRRGYRLIALLLPLLFLAGLEGVLRLAGFGDPTSFFLKKNIGGRQMLVANNEFAQRYFPPGLARSPEPCMIPAAKTPGTFRVFVFGESAALGDPEPAYGFSRLLQLLLEAQYPGKHFEIVNVAVTAINSHVIRRIARDCSSLHGDAWILYMGNNEVVGPFGPGTVFGRQAPPMLMIHANLALKATRIGQLLDRLRARFMRGTGAPASWEGMEMFLKHQIRPEDPRLQRMYAHFQQNLTAILRQGRAAGVPVLLSTVAVNLKDCPPFASLHRPGLSTAQLKQWDQAFAAGIESERSGNAAAALASYQSAAAVDDTYAELSFRLGRCLLALDKADDARRAFSNARDQDALRFRTDTRLNQVIREIAAAERSRGVTLVDAEQSLAGAAARGIPGHESFLEHVHFNFEGNYRIARSLADELAKVLPAGTRASTNSSPWLTLEVCRQRLAFTDYDLFQLSDEMLKRLQQPPFTSQLDHQLEEAAWAKQLTALQNATRPDGMKRALEIYRQALALRPDDAVILEKHARLLQDAGDPVGAEKAWRAVLQLLPEYPEACYALANVLDAQGKPAQAIEWFHQALRRKSKIPEARNGLGLVLAGQGQLDEAMLEYQRALQLKPDLLEARVNMGQLLARQGRLDDARLQYEEVLRANSNNVAAHINLGKLLSAQGNKSEAARHYQAAVRLKPGNAVGHYNLANAYSSLGDTAAAIAEFREAIRCSPGFIEACLNLALELGKAGQNDAAIQQLQDLIKLKPDFAEAHLNLGVALAKTQRYDEAAAAFREVLRLDPANVPARDFLGKVRAKSGAP